MNRLMERNIFKLFKVLKTLPNEALFALIDFVNLELERRKKNEKNK